VKETVTSSRARVERAGGEKGVWDYVRRSRGLKEIVVINGTHPTRKYLS
jgi:hypothetical protein